MNLNDEQMRVAAERMQSMNPDAMRAQAQQLRSMPPDVVRRSNPAMANFSDQQIKDAATQMEQMAENPAMMKMAAEQMQNMTPQQREEMGRMMNQQSGASAQPIQQANQGIPIGTRVVIDGLKSAPQHNGKIGIVKASLTANGRQNICVEDGGNEMLLRSVNFKPEPREISSLSIKEMQAVLTASGMKPAQLTGADKSELASLIEDKVKNKEDISLLIAKAKAPPPTTTSPGISPSGPGSMMSEEQLRKGAESMANADPATLRAQAQQLRSMPPDVVRRSNPAMANFSDQQIKDAATQMEQMAENPDMIKMAAEQMKNMTPQQLEEMKRMMSGGGPPSPSTPSSFGSVTAAGGDGAVTGGGGSPLAMPTDPSQMMNMDPKQIKSMMTMLKSNPAMLKNLRSMIPGGESISEEAFTQQINSLSDMDENQIKNFMTYAQTAQKAMTTFKSGWDKVNAVCFGQLLKILIVVGTLLGLLLMKWLFFSPSNVMSSSDDGFQSYGSSSSNSGGGGGGGVMSEYDGFGDDSLGYVPMTNQAAHAHENMASAHVGAGGEVDDEFD